MIVDAGSTLDAVVDRGTHYRQSLRLKLMLQSVQSRNLFATRQTVSGPEIQQHNLTLKFLQAKGLACECLKLDVRQRREICVRRGSWG